YRPLVAMDGYQYRCVVTDRCDQTAESTAVSLEVAALSATVSLTGEVRKVYDGTNVATVGGDNFLLSGVLEGDEVSLELPVLAEYDNENLGEGKIVYIEGLALTGDDAANYLLAATTVNASVGEI